ncbi:hypothetical protein L6452_31826 [Arctium lappa]|uniref:Uncharacterized protein n=1 Tax=Arctium lappa TaxID=4217 RepID=A0ACB8Z737_ARCLA|nr:hypothetical protein L6452_31826 [Arctium lappa]
MPGHSAAEVGVEESQKHNDDLQSVKVPSTNVGNHQSQPTSMASRLRVQINSKNVMLDNDKVSQNGLMVGSTQKELDSRPRNKIAHEKRRVEHTEARRCGLEHTHRISVEESTQVYEGLRGRIGDDEHG